MKPELDEFEVMVRTARDHLPEPFRSLSADVMVRVADFAEPDMLDELGIGDPIELLGLYQGTDVTQKSVLDIQLAPDMVWLYRLPILRMWMTGEDSLDEIIEHVLVHEIGHHFGLSDDDMYGLEDEAYEEEG